MKFIRAVGMTLLTIVSCYFVSQYQYECVAVHWYVLPTAVILAGAMLLLAILSIICWFDWYQYRCDREIEKFINRVKEKKNE